MKRFLIVVDMQNDFITGALGSREAEEIVEQVAKRIRSFDGEILYTMDSHRPDYLATQEGRRLPVPHCVVGTEGWQLAEPILLALRERSADTAGCMLMKNGFGSVDLPARVREVAGEDPEISITLVGLCTDICVISNAMLLKAFLPEAEIAVDAACCAGVTPESHQTALSAMRACQIDVI